MTEEEFEREQHFYREAILEIMAHVELQSLWEKELRKLSTRFAALAQSDRPFFRQLCARLLEDKRYEVRLGAIELIRFCKIQDDALSMILLTIAFKDKNLRKDALYALYPTRTRRVLPQILLLADKGYSSALDMARPMLQTPEEIERGIAIARKYLTAREYELREAALILLQRHSTMEIEAESVLRAVQQYTDELFIDALKEAPPEMVLEPLKALRSRFPEKSAEYGDVSSTIHTLEQKKNNVDEPEGDYH